MPPGVMVAPFTVAEIRNPRWDWLWRRDFGCPVDGIHRRRQHVAPPLPDAGRCTRWMCYPVM